MSSKNKLVTGDQTELYDINDHPNRSRYNNSSAAGCGRADDWLLCHQSLVSWDDEDNLLITRADAVL